MRLATACMAAHVGEVIKVNSWGCGRAGILPISVWGCVMGANSI